MLIISTISKAFFRHVQGITFRDLWLSLEKAYTPHSISREYTHKTQLLRIEMHGDETPDAYLNRAQEYADALATIGEPVKDKDLVMLAVSCIRKEYNGLKITITARQSPSAFSELHVLLSDHDYMLEKFVHLLRLSLHLLLQTTQFQVSPITPSGPQAIYGVRPSNNMNNNNHSCGNRNNSRGNYNNRDTGANSHVTDDLEAMDNSEAYYGDDTLHVGNGKGHPILHIGSSKVYSPQKTFSLKNILHSSNGQPSLVSTTSTPTPPPPPITRQRPANLCQNPKQRVPYNPFANHAAVLPITITKPTSFTVANNFSEWRQAMKEEHDALMKNGTWSLVPHASNTNVIDDKWVYRLKRDKNGVVTCYKARFIAKGFRQQPGIDFHETFSPVVKSITIRAVLSLAVTNDWPLRQLDIQNTFLHGNLKKQVYMKQPSGFIDPQRPNHVCLLHKSLYGLKQAPRAWFVHLSKALFDLGFKGFKTNPSLFIYSRGDTLLYIMIYVDDNIVTCNNKGTIDNIFCQLEFAFSLKDLRPLNNFFGIKIVSHVSDTLLSQKKYILELLQSDGLSNCNLVSSPLVTSSSLSLDDNTAFSNPVKYRQVVGSLQYVTLSRPDIAFVVNKVCQYMHAPTENHWSTVKRILQYLHGTVEHGMLICRSSCSTLQAFTDMLWKGNPDTSLEAFSDADSAGDSDDRPSTGGFAIYLGSNLISWTARKQRTISRSSTKAEYKALDDTVAEFTWLQALLNELGIHSFSTPIL
nr:retrotransposon protein, putative, Ty1-copia subclass [Tanacetum cinerariifolium]